MICWKCIVPNYISLSSSRVLWTLKFPPLPNTICNPPSLQGPVLPDVFPKASNAFPRNSLECHNAGSFSYSDARSASSFVMNFFIRVSFLKPQNGSGPIKEVRRQTLLWPFLTYGADTCRLTKGRKCIIYIRTWNIKEIWGSVIWDRYSRYHLIYRIVKEPVIVTYIDIQILM